MQPQTSLAGLYWPGATAQSPLMLNPAAQANPAAAIAMYAAMRGATPTSGFYPAMAPATSIYSAVPDPTSLASLVAGFYQLPTSTATVPTSVYNPVDLLSGPSAALFTPGGVSPAAYAAAVAAVNATRQAAMAPPTPSVSVSVPRNNEELAAGAFPSRKREATGVVDVQSNVPPSKRIHSAGDDAADTAAAVSHAASVVNQSQLTSSLAFNTWLQQQQQQQHQLTSPPPPPTATSPTVALQAAALMRLQQQQQQWAAMTAGYGALAGLTPNPAAAAAYSTPTALFDSLAFQSAGLNANPYTTSLLQNQTVLTNVAYINDEGQLLESLPICRDFKAGKCHRNTDCRYVHLIDENVEVNQGRVTVCRDAAKGRCTRVPCKYYHIPLLAISASRSLALNSALSAAVAANTFSANVPATTSATTTSPTSNTAANCTPASSSL